MKIIGFSLLALLFAGCIHADKSAFTQGRITIVPPITNPMETEAAERKSSLGENRELTDQDIVALMYTDGGTVNFPITDATGKTFSVFVDHRIGSKTPGAIYLNAYPGERGSVRIRNPDEFRRKLGDITSFYE